MKKFVTLIALALVLGLY